MALVSEESAADDLADEKRPLLAAAWGENVGA
jgi:hypothetical protein